MLIDPRTFRRLVEVRACLLDGMHEDLTIADLAAGAALSPSRLIRVFTALFGTTPHQLRTQARLDRARALLAAGAPVTDVCMEVGFSSLGSFSALFTRWTITPPSQYRAAQAAAPGCLSMLGQLPRNFGEAPPG